MVVLRTARLRLIPLSGQQLELSLQGDGQLECSLGLVAQEPCYAPDPDLRSALEQMVRMIEKAGDHHLWCTHWQIVHAEERRIVGGCCFHGPPDARGQVEVGYGIEAPYRRRGYATEALRAMIAWAAQQPAVRTIAAETRRDNVRSQGVLAKLGFRIAYETQTAYWWRLAAIDAGSETASWSPDSEHPPHAREEMT